MGAILDLQLSGFGVFATLMKLQARLENLSGPMADIGETIVSQVQDCFERQKAPDGTPWTPSKRAEKTGGATLKEHGGLIASLGSYPTDFSVEIGMSKIYAATHQYGAKAGAFGTMSNGGSIPWGDIPARPMLPDETTMDTEEINGVLLDYLTGGE